jgi:hypothetical protein
MMPHRLVRPLVGYATIACATPYLALKVIWLQGGELGVANVGMMRDTSMVALNIVTAGMDLVGITIALAFTHAWGQRVPAWLVLPPAWVAMGLLVRFVLAVPLTLLARALTFGGTPPSPSAIAVATGPVHSWVYMLVYGEFVGLGIGLSLAFVLYARVRWRAVFQPADAAQACSDAMTPNATRAAQVSLAVPAALMAAALGALHVAWAGGAALGVPSDLVARRTLSSHVINAVDGVVMMGAAIGILTLVHRPRNRPEREDATSLSHHRRVWLPLSLTWIGSGFLFSWGLWGLVNILGNTALVRDRAATMAALNLLGLAEMIAGLVIGVVMLFVLAARTEL